MIKLANTDNKVYVCLSSTEFEFLTKKNPDSVEPGTYINLNWIKSLTNSVQNFREFIIAAKEKSDELSVKLSEMIT